MCKEKETIKKLRIYTTVIIMYFCIFLIILCVSKNEVRGWMVL